MSRFWKKKRVLVTGADGFMGSHLAERLLAEGASVTAFVRGTSVTGPTQHRLKNLSSAAGRLSGIIAGDIACAESIFSIADDSPEIIFHLAADAYVPNSFKNPMSVLETNLTGTLNVLLAARRLPRLSRVVCTSSSEIYGTARYAPIDEAHPLNPTSPYAASKAAADRLAYSFHETFGLPVAVIRPFNTYGPRHTYDVIPKFIRLAAAGKDLPVHGSGKQSRDFTYVDDMVEAFLLMGSHPAAVGRCVNFGTGKDVSILRTAREIARIAGSRSRIVHTADRPAEVRRLVCDWGLARRALGWRPRVGFEEGLARNVEWYRRYGR